MRIFFLILILLFSVSCKKEDDTQLYNKILSEINKGYQKGTNELMLQNINLLKKTNNNTLMNANNFSIDYFNYLDSIQKLCKKNYSPFFYEGEKTEETIVGKQFLTKTNDFLIKWNNSIKNQTLKKKSFILLGVEDIKIDDEITVVFIDYYFRDIDCEAFFYLIENRKRNVLLIQNELILMTLLEECHKKEK